MIITDASKFARLGEIVDKALDLPRGPDHRGSRCPPAPFGRTERYAAPVDRDNDGFQEYEIPTNVSNAVGSSNRLTGLERAEYATLIIGAVPSGSAAEVK